MSNLNPTRTFQRTLFGADGGTTGIDDDFAARDFNNIGAWILGRNMSVLLGGGERLFEGTDLRAPGYECVQFVASQKAAHVLLRRKGNNDA